jgi:hypothetical protein
MPQFSNEPPEDPRGHALQLVRTPAGRGLVAVVTSDDLIGCPTHFWGGRTTPCEKTDCKPCLAGVPWRWHAWLAAWAPSNHHHFIFEMTARVAKIFVAYRDTYSTLRGCKFRAQRRSMAANSRVHLECQPADLEGLALPEPPQMVKCMSIIWNIREPEIDVEGVLRSVTRVVVDRKGNGELITGDGQLFAPTDEAGPNNPTVPRLQCDR